MGNSDIILGNEIKNKKLRRAGYIACSVIFGITLSVLCVFLAVYMVTFNRTIYHNSMVREDAVINSHDLTQEQLDYVIDDVLKYLTDGRALMDTSIEGYEGELFTETEISHMVDVKAIFNAIKWITIACAVIAPLALIGAIFIDRERYRKRHRRLFVTTLIGNAVIIGVLVLLMVINFNDIFVLFHRLIFTNEDWILNKTDLLIEMLPESLFMRLGIFISVTYISLLLLSCLIGIFQKRIGALIKKVFKKRRVETAGNDSV